MTSTPHTDCPHPATKAARTACRKARAARAASRAAEVNALVASYYDNSGDAEEIIFALGAIDPALIKGYYDNSLDIEEIIANAR